MASLPFFKQFFKIYLFIYLFLAALGLCCCAWAFSSCGERGLLFVAVLGLLIAVASLVVEHGLQARGLQQFCPRGLVAPRHVGSSRLGLEPVSPALAGAFLTTVPPGGPALFLGGGKEKKFRDNLLAPLVPFSINIWYLCVTLFSTRVPAMCLLCLCVCVYTGGVMWHTVLQPEFLCLRCLFLIITYIFTLFFLITTQYSFTILLYKCVRIKPVLY